MSSVYVVTSRRKCNPRVYSTLRMAANSIAECQRWILLSDGRWVAYTDDGDMFTLTRCEIERGKTRGKYAKKEC